MSFSDEQVEQVYGAYPRKVGKSAAKRKIKAALRGLVQGDGPEGVRDDPAAAVAWLLDRVTAYADSRKSEDPQFTPHPSTWFGQGRFLDETQPSNGGGNGGNGDDSHEPDLQAQLAESRAYLDNLAAGTLPGYEPTLTKEERREKAMREGRTIGA